MISNILYIHAYTHFMFILYIDIYIYSIIWHYIAYIYTVLYSIHYINECIFWKSGYHSDKKLHWPKYGKHFTGTYGHVLLVLGPNRWGRNVWRSPTAPDYLRHQCSLTSSVAAPWFVARQNGIWQNHLQPTMTGTRRWLHHIYIHVVVYSYIPV